MTLAQYAESRLAQIQAGLAAARGFCARPGRVAWALVGIGVALRVVEYLCGRPFW